MLAILIWFFPFSLACMFCVCTLHVSCYGLALLFVYLACFRGFALLLVYVFIDLVDVKKPEACHVVASEACANVGVLGSFASRSYIATSFPDTRIVSAGSLLCYFVSWLSEGRFASYALVALLRAFVCRPGQLG